MNPPDPLVPFTFQKFRNIIAIKPIIFIVAMSKSNSKFDEIKESVNESNKDVAMMSSDPSNQKNKKPLKTSEKNHNLNKMKTISIVPKKIEITTQKRASYFEDYRAPTQIFAKNPQKTITLNRIQNFIKRTSSAPLNLLNQIRVLIRAAKMLRFRTKFRNLKYVNVEQIKLIDDISYFPEKPQKLKYIKRFTEKNVIFLFLLSKVYWK